MKKMRKGFTLIELMIVIAIIAIIAAIAIPNLMRSRILANEANAVAALKQYQNAQVTFQTGRQGAAPRNTNAGYNGYCDNFGNLFYGQPVAQKTDGGREVDPGRNLALIGQVFADAIVNAKITGAADVNLTDGPTKQRSSSADYQGYVFAEDTSLVRSLTMPDPDNAGGKTYSNHFPIDFALVAVPINSATAGNNAFWVGQQASVWRAGLKPDVRAAQNFTTVVGGKGDGAHTPWKGGDAAAAIWDTN